MGTSTSSKPESWVEVVVARMRFGFADAVLAVAEAAVAGAQAPASMAHRRSIATVRLIDLSDSFISLMEQFEKLSIPVL
jgi:hypothetical protein